MSERRVLGYVGNIIENLMTRISTNLSRLWLILSQFLKLADQTNSRILFFDVFPQYLELLMSEGKVVGVVGSIIGNPMTHISTKMSRLHFILSQFPKRIGSIAVSRYLKFFRDILS